MEVSGQHHAPAALPPGQRRRGTQWSGGWMSPKVGLDVLGWDTSLDLTGDHNPGRPDRTTVRYKMQLQQKVTRI
jgi:hypothetical protein